MRRISATLLVTVMLLTGSSTLSAQQDEALIVNLWPAVEKQPGMLVMETSQVASVSVFSAYRGSMILMSVWTVGPQPVTDIPFLSALVGWTDSLGRWGTNFWIPAELEGARMTLGVSVLAPGGIVVGPARQQIKLVGPGQSDGA